MTSKVMSGLAIAAIASTAFVGVALAQRADGGIDTASGGNGGVSTANASGGSVGIGATNTGGGRGSEFRPPSMPRSSRATTSPRRSSPPSTASNPQKLT